MIPLHLENGGLVQTGVMRLNPNEKVWIFQEKPLITVNLPIAVGPSALLMKTSISGMGQEFSVSNTPAEKCPVPSRNMMEGAGISRTE
jgi:hypothetical protein